MCVRDSPHPAPPVVVDIQASAAVPPPAPPIEDTPQLVPAKAPGPRILESAWGANAAVLRTLSDDVPYLKMWRWGHDAANNSEGAVWVPPALLAELSYEQLLNQLLYMQGPYPGCEPDAYDGCFDPFLAKPPFPPGGLPNLGLSSASSSAAATPVPSVPAFALSLIYI